MLVKRDRSPVVERGAPKSITVEDSFRTCNSMEVLQLIVLKLVPDLAKRVADVRQSFVQTEFFL